MKKYITVQGDMWDSIAYAQLGNADYADKLMNANLQYREYYIFPAGRVSDGMPPWKQVGG